jgi:hypothetical protein
MKSYAKKRRTARQMLAAIRRRHTAILKNRGRKRK